MTARVARLAEGHLEATPLGEIAITGLAEPHDHVSSSRGRRAPAPARDRPRPRPRPRSAAASWRWPRSRKRSGTPAQGTARSSASSASPASASTAPCRELLRSDHLRKWGVLERERGGVRQALAIPARRRATARRARRRRGRRCGDGPRRLAEAPDRAEEESALLSPVLGAPRPGGRRRALGCPRRRPAAATHARRRRNTRDPPRARGAPLSRDRGHRTGSTTRHRPCSTRSWRALPLSRVIILMSYPAGVGARVASKSYYCQVHVNPLPAAAAGALFDALLGRRARARRGPATPDRAEGGRSLLLEESVRNLVEHLRPRRRARAYRSERTPRSRICPRACTPRSPRDRSACTRGQAGAPGGLRHRRGCAAPVARGGPDVAEEELRAGLGGSRSTSSCTRPGSIRRSRTPSARAHQEMAYAGLVRDRRHALHARIVKAVERRPGGGAPDSSMSSRRTVRAEPGTRRFATAARRAPARSRGRRVAGRRRICSRPWSRSSTSPRAGSDGAGDRPRPGAPPCAEPTRRVPADTRGARRGQAPGRSLGDKRRRGAARRSCATRSRCAMTSCRPSSAASGRRASPGASGIQALEAVAPPRSPSPTGRRTVQSAQSKRGTARDPTQGPGVSVALSG